MAVSGESRNGSKTLRAPLMVSLVLIVFAAVVAGGTVLILTAMNKMAFHANTLDTQRAQQTASGALASFEQQIASATSDYSAWDDAAKAVYVDRDREWMEKNYGVFTGAGTLFDTYFLVTPGGETAMAYQQGSPFAARFTDYFGSSFDTLRASLEKRHGARHLPEDRVCRNAGWHRGRRDCGGAVQSGQPHGSKGKCHLRYLCAAFERGRDQPACA